MDDYQPNDDTNEARRDDDAQVREASRQYDMPIRDAITGEPVRVHVVSWVNNTFWRFAVALAFAGSLFAIYDNGQRVDRLEGQVCESLSISRINLDTLDYYKDHPDERDAAERNIMKDLSRFHCPDPDSPTITSIGAGASRIQNGVLGFGRVTFSGRPR